MKGQNTSLQDANTFRRLYEHAHLAVYRYVYGSLGGPAQDVEDLTAETFLRAWKARQRFEGNDEAAVGWLLRIAHNLIIDKYRRKKTHGLDEELDETNFSIPQAGPEEQLLMSEQIRILQRLMQNLAPDQREMIVLRYMLDWPVQRIAQHMGMPENTVSVNLRRILQRLRDRWPA
jgi:RNA polymerase sigma-70 factor (ECF subfamily)